MTTYKDCGVSIQDNDEWVKSLIPICSKTFNKNVRNSIGGFCSLYNLSNGMILASSTDGIGSKLQLANDLGCLDTIGFDLVGMVINDILTCGANPMFLLDYFAVNSIEVMKNKMPMIINGIASACKIGNVALVGGETAELPGLFKTENEYDISGFGCGWVYESQLRGPHKVKVGDSVIGIESSGPHSNGYSLINRHLKTHLQDSEDLRYFIMRPTFIYTSLISALRFPSLNSMVHITGGGLKANTLRAIPDSLDVEWELPPLPKTFKFIQNVLEIEEEEMRKVFNCGIGYVLIVENGYENRYVDIANQHGFKAFKIGKIIKKD